MAVNVNIGAEIEDFEADAAWFLSKNLMSFAIFAPVLIFGPWLHNAVADAFPAGFHFSAFGRPLFMPPNPFRITIEYFPIIALAAASMANRVVAVAITRRISSIVNKRRLLDVFIHFGEIIMLLTIHYTGGIESPLTIAFVSHVVTLSSILRRSSLMKHIVFMSFCLGALTILEYIGVVPHFQAITPAIHLYKNPAYATIACVAIIVFMFYVEANMSNAVRKSIEREKIKNALFRYISPSIASEMLGKDSVTLGGERKTVTSLFADIRDFTGHSETRSPEKVVAQLNEFFSEMVGVITRHGGTLDKFIGDAIMATFGVPAEHPDDPLRAVEAALDMRDSLTILRAKWRREDVRPFKIGIGVNTGDAVAGNVGSVDRMEYTVIGDSVNTAARIEQLTKKYRVDIIISDNTYKLVKDSVRVRPLGRARFHGKSETMHIYELLALKD